MTEDAAEVEMTTTPGRKIAMLGTAPSTRSRAPIDSDWEVWLQADYWADLKRVDRWFEFGTMERLVKDFPDYLEFLKKAKCPIWMREAFPDIPNSQLFPFTEVADAYGEEFMTATVVWMMGMAFNEHNQGKKIDAIGLWGYDMALDGEYVHQRPGIQHMKWIAEKILDIKVHIPLGSDLLIPPIPYPFADTDPMVAKTRARRNDILRRLEVTQQGLDQANAQVASGNSTIAYLKGALEDNTYYERMACGVTSPAA